eukprot:3646527-Rhodomonas_salina.5
METGLYTPAARCCVAHGWTWGQFSTSYCTVVYVSVAPQLAALLLAAVPDGQILTEKREMHHTLHPTTVTFRTPKPPTETKYPISASIVLMVNSPHEACLGC